MIFRKIRNRWDAYLKRLGDANAKNFGNGPLECCKLNRYDSASAPPPHHSAR